MNRPVKNQTGHALAVVLVVAVVVVAGLAGWWVAGRHHNGTKTTSTNTHTQTANTNTSATPPGATDNGSLNQDLQSISGSMGQESTDSNTANNGLADQQSEISVPTN